MHICLIGPSGSGKTCSALKITEGFSGRIVMLDRKRGSGPISANLFSYDTAELNPPFDLGRYVQDTQGAAEAGYDVLVLDSLTHAWDGEGGKQELRLNTTAKVLEQLYSNKSH
ncbi:AAA domain-containing protein [Desulfonatronum zhilinae]|nr:AAA domain-containing protein [Desulfonatronum zhilinae]